MGNNRIEAFWSRGTDELFSLLATSAAGLPAAEAADRFRLYGPNRPLHRRRFGWLSLLFSQFTNPVILILLSVAVISLFLQNPTNALLIIIIVLVSSLLGFRQEKSAGDAMAALLSIVRVHSSVLRDGTEIEIPLEHVVPGDIISLYGGESVAGDAVLIESEDLTVNEASLTGETFPVEKKAGPVAAGTGIKGRTNTIFMGTHIVSGTGKALVVATGRLTELGRISAHLQKSAPLTEFERGIRQFGSFLLQLTVVMVLFILAVNIYFKRPFIQSLLFSAALAVSITPQLLPAIISVNLSRGAKTLAKNKVIVKRFSAIENFGAMTTLCADKTGTLTEGTVQLRAALDVDGMPCDTVFSYAYLTAVFVKGYVNPIDRAITAYRTLDVSAYTKLSEMQYDFTRKRMGILVNRDNAGILIAKGAFYSILKICNRARMSDGTIVDVAAAGDRITRTFNALGDQGFRVIAVAYREADNERKLTKEDEKEMIFIGFVTFSDPVKEDVAAAIGHLRTLHVAIKIVTGDNANVARHVGRAVGLRTDNIATGDDIAALDGQALTERIRWTEIFAEMDPDRKEKLVRALKECGEVVGFIGDGINDAPALHAADVGISVNTATDVAKETASIVLLEKSLEVIADGIAEGRRTFVNTLKYIFMSTSANFGGAFSMTGAAVFLPFLPLLPQQVLLNNLLTDMPAMTIATDNVDEELIDRPRRWSISFIRRFMLTFGLMSSVFDYLTFGVLLYVLHADATLFRSGWFMESVATSALVVLVIRSRRPFFKSLPSVPLIAATLLDVAVVTALPSTFVGRLFGFVPLPRLFATYLGIIVALFIIGAELVKKLFYAAGRGERSG